MKRVACVLALLLLPVAAFALLVEGRFAQCPSGEHVSCATLVRPALKTLFIVPIAPTFFVFAGAEALAAFLLLQGEKPRFARNAALASAVGAGFAVGLQPLAFLVEERPCPLCLLAVLLQLALAFAFARIAREKAPLWPIGVAFFSALLVTGALATAQGTAQREKDRETLARLAKLGSGLGGKSARLVLVERPGCPYCEALLLDVLSKPELADRLALSGLTRREASAGEGAPILIALDSSGHEVAREEGFSPEPGRYEVVFQAALR